MRIKIIKDSGKYRAGQVLVMESKLAYNLIGKGVAQITKDMTAADYKTSNGNTRNIRINNSK